MDPNQRPRPPAEDQGQAPTTGPAAAETGSLGLAPPRSADSNSNLASSARAASPSRSPSPSRPSLRASTPAADADANTESFPALDVSSSLLHVPSNSALASRTRTSSNAAASSDGAAPEPPRQPSIRIRRRSSSIRSNRSASKNDDLARVPTHVSGAGSDAAGNSNTAAGDGASSTRSAGESSGRRPRSISQPERAHVPQDAAALARHSRRVPQIAMPRLTEEGARPTMEELSVANRAPSPTQSLPEQRLSLSRTRTEPDPSEGGPRLQRMRKMSRMFWPRRQANSHLEPQPPQGPSEPPVSACADDEYNERLVDYLDTIDPEVQTLSTLTNVQNSLFVPDLGKWVNRRPTYTLSEHDVEQMPLKPKQPPAPAAPELGGISEDRGDESAAQDTMPDERPPLQRSSTITSHLTDSHYAALPHGTTLEGWTAEEKWELDDHVRHMMHSRRSKFKRTLKGFGQYVRRPLGFLVTLYATLITLFGLAWVLFLIGWIYVGEKQVYAIHVIDSVLVALFAIMGDGLAPFRAVDTYHMAFVVHYARKIKKEQNKAHTRRQEKNAPSEVRQSMELAAAPQAQEPLRTRDGDVDADADADEQSATSNNNPHARRNNIVDAEEVKSGIEAYDDTPLTYAEQKRLFHHQKKLAKSHSFYKPNETPTHYAFPLDYLIAIVILLDCHSCLQISLGACTWGIDYHTRPFALTTVILCVSITCNITAGIVITVGDRKTRKKDVWQLMTRQELTGDAMKAIEQKRSESNKADRTGESDIDTDREKESRESNSLVRKPS